MKISCPTNLHEGVFQAMDGSLCKHKFYVNNWRSGLKENQPNNITKMDMSELIKFENFDAILVHDVQDYKKLMDLKREIEIPIIFYSLITSRGWNWNEVYKNPYVIPIYLFTGLRISLGDYDGLHKTLNHGIDTDFWNGWDVKKSKKEVVYVKNNYQGGDPIKYGFFKYVAKDYPNTVIGSGGDMETDEHGVLEKHRSSRVFLNIEPRLSSGSTAMLEAMATGIPVVCNDVECCGEFIRNGYNGFISNSNDYLRAKVDELMNDDELANRIGENGRKTIIDMFGKNLFNDNWNDFLDNLNLYNRTTWRK